MVTGMPVCICERLRLSPPSCEHTAEGTGRTHLNYRRSRSPSGKTCAGHSQIWIKVAPEHWQAPTTAPITDLNNITTENKVWR